MKLERNLIFSKIEDVFDIDLERRDDFHQQILTLAEGMEDETELYQKVLFLLSHLQFSKKDAQKHWQNIIEHKKQLSQTLDRPLAFRVAMIDYFMTEMDIYEQPMMVELFIYESEKYNAMMDELTGIYNHRFLREYLWKETKRSMRYHKKFSVIIIDIDDFKGINDRYGELAGDEILKRIGFALEANMRIEDVASRYGGDEFVLILPETTKEGALAFSSRIKRLVESVEVQFGSICLSVKVSMGVSTFIEDTEDPVQILELADKALYRAKFMGKNRIAAYNEKDFE